VRAPTSHLRTLRTLGDEWFLTAACVLLISNAQTLLLILGEAEEKLTMEDDMINFLNLLKNLIYHSNVFVGWQFWVTVALGWIIFSR
jgi:hypothetical protein